MPISSGDAAQGRIVADLERALLHDHRSGKVVGTAQNEEAVTLLYHAGTAGDAAGTVEVIVIVGGIDRNGGRSHTHARGDVNRCHQSRGIIKQDVIALIEGIRGGDVSVEPVRGDGDVPSGTADGIPDQAVRAAGDDQIHLPHCVGVEREAVA
jgi:hypothetical protein